MNASDLHVAREILQLKLDAFDSLFAQNMDVLYEHPCFVQISCSMSAFTNE